MSTPSWEGDYAKTIVEMMRVLSGNNKVLYVENPATWLDVFRLLTKGKTRQAFRLISNNPRRVEERDHCVYVLNPGPVIPINFLPHNRLYRNVLRWNNLVVKRKVKHVLSKLKMEKELIHINAFNPMVAADTGRAFGENILVYYCYDNIAAAHYMKDHGAQLEPDLLATADLTVATSEGLLEQKQPLARKIALVKNGVDYDLFSQGFREKIPEEKVIGYIGSIDDRLDTEVLSTCFKACPDWTFEFVGRVNHEPAEQFLRSFPNVRLRGSFPSSDLPVFLREYAAGIIPFVKNEFTRGIYPLKINEYLSAGLPVVLTDFGLLGEFREISRICSSPKEFSEALTKEVMEDTAEKRKLRKEFARNNSWLARAEVLSAAIEETENGRSSEPE